jgi:S1-C subfamily serine protease
MKKTLYDILGVAADADHDQIVLAYRNRIEDAAAEHLDPNERVLLKEAYSVLSQANQRAAYDASLARQAQAPRIDPVEVNFDEPPSRPWFVWVAVALVLAGIIYAWQGRKAPKPQPVVVDRVVILNGPALEQAPQQTLQQAALPAPVPAASGGKSAEELFAQLAPSTAMVLATNRNNGRTAQGSGVVIERGTLITNCHVTQGSTEIEVRIGGQVHSARVDTADEEFDLCRLNVSGMTAPSVAIADVAAVRPGQKVLALGAPKGLELTISEGIVSALREVPDGTLIQTTAPISPGSSGGGLFNSAGELVGIITLTSRYGQNLNFAVPADWIGRMRDRPASATGEGGAAGYAPRKIPTASGSNSATERILGKWHCFRPDIGRHVDFQFLPDGNIVGSELDHALGGRYSVSGDMLTLYGSRQRYFRIEGMTDNHMVLTEGHLRIACDRTP